MAGGTVIDGLLARSNELHAFLRGQKELSLALEAEANFKKLLLLACGSFFEEQITGMLESFANSKGETRLAAFVRNKLKRQYHTLFTWEGPHNVNSFVGLFGEEFKKDVAAKVAASEQLSRGMKGFLWIGQRRNQLAHGNIARVPIDETQEEIVVHYNAAWEFVRFVANEFGERCSADSGNESVGDEAQDD